MKNKKYLIIIFLLFAIISNAKEYKINLLLDNNSTKLFKKIEKETQKLFINEDKIDFLVNFCKNSCENNISNNDIIILNKNNKIKKVKNKIIISYNNISNSYEENKIIRTSALKIFEYLKENKKSDSLYIKNIIPKTKIDESNKKKSDNTLSLEKLYELTFSNNLNIKQNINSLKIDKLNTAKSKSYYKPKIDFYSNIIQIDKDRARYSSGQYSQGTVDMGVKLSQLIYSNSVLQNIKIKKLLEKSNKNSLKAQNDEIYYKVVLTYLNVLKANKYNEIIKIKQNFIKQNLEFSKSRVEIGVKDRSDIFRWENELANTNIELANAKKELNYLKIELANLLQISKEFSFDSYSMNSFEFQLLNKEAIKYILNKKVQNLFLNQIISSHSRLKQIKELINAKNKEFKMNKSSKYLPNIAFEGNTRKIINRYGEASNTIRYWNDNEYEAVINLSLPLYEGGIKDINIQKNEIELINLKLEYNNIKNLIQKNIEQNYDSLEKSYEKISYAKTSLDFSKKNFQLIQDKYRNGKENIISLLDAQNSYIISKINKNISILDHLIDLSSFYFFSGNIDILENKNKKEDLEQNILKAIR